MKFFKRAYYLKDEASPREELRIVHYELTTMTLEIGPNSDLRTIQVGAIVPLITSLYKLDPGGMETLIQAKLVARDGDILRVVFTDSSEMHVSGPAEEMACSFEGLDLAITAFSEHPWFISHPIEFQVAGVSPGRLFLDFRRTAIKDLIPPGMELTLQIQIPRSGTFKAKGQVQAVWQEEGSRIRLSFALKDPEETLREAICLRVLKSGSDFSIETLLGAGLRLPRFKGSLSSGIILESTDFPKVLELRRRAYLGKKEHRFSPDVPAETFHDRFDTFSAIIGVRLGASLIGTGRVVFNFGALEQCELAELGFEVPAEILEMGFVEASRFATDERFRKRDVFKILLLIAIQQAHYSGHRYILMDCEDHLLPVYQRLGATKVGKKIRHPWEGIELNVVYFDLSRLVKTLELLKHLPELAPTSKEVERAMTSHV